MSLPVQPPAERLTAAFARAADARYAIGILETCGDGPVRATLEPVFDDRGEVQLVMLHIEIDGIARDRVLSAISGGHGVAMSSPTEAQRRRGRGAHRLIPRPGTWTSGPASPRHRSVGNAARPTPTRPVAVRWRSGRRSMPRNAVPTAHGRGASIRPMAPTRYDTIIVGGGSAGSVLANRLSEDPATRVLVLEAGRSDWRIDPFIHMPAALTFPIGSRFYDWMYESEPEPHMHGRRIYHARGKVLGGSSSINGQIFQRGNPLDYERWAADPGMASWDYAHCLPYFKRMETCLAAAPDDPWRGHGGPLVPGARPGHQPAVRGVLRCDRGGRLPAHRGRQRLSPGGLRAVRPEHPPGPPAVRRARLPASDHAPPHGT